MKIQKRLLAAALSAAMAFTSVRAYTPYGLDGPAEAQDGAEAVPGDGSGLFGAPMDAEAGSPDGGGSAEDGLLTGVEATPSEAAATPSDIEPSVSGSDPYDVLDGLVEIEPDEDEELLDMDALSDGVLKALQEGPKAAPIAAAPPTQAPVTDDGVTIERNAVQWVTNSAGFDQLLLEPEGDTAAAQFEIDFSCSGTDVYRPGQLQIVFPAHIWMDRYQKRSAKLTLSVPEDPEKGAQFAYRYEGDKVLVTNTKSLSASHKVMIQGTFHLDPVHGFTDGTVSDAFWASLTVITPNKHELTLESNQISAKLDTHAAARRATKTAYDKTAKKYSIWWEEVPEEIPKEWLPEKKDDYGYAKWYVSGTASGNQPFTMTMTDTIQDGYGGILLGAVIDGNNFKSEDKKTVTATLYDGYSTTVKSAYVWTAYKKADVPDGEAVQLKNNLTVTVTGSDGLDGATTMSAEEAVLEARKPITYTFIKHWEDGNDAKQHRPSSMDLLIYKNDKLWKIVPLTEEDAESGDGENDWTYRWSDGGSFADSYEVGESLTDAGGWLEDPEYGQDDYHQNSWQYVLTGTDYDPASHTWKYTNSYSEGWIRFEISDIWDNAASHFDRRKDSNWDRDLNNLYNKNKEVEVRFDMGATISAALESMWYGVSPNTFILESSDCQFMGQAMDAEDMDIASVMLEQPTVRQYVPGSYGEDGYYETETFNAPEATLYVMIGGASRAVATLADGKAKVLPGSGASIDPENPMHAILPKGVTKAWLQFDSDAEVAYINFDVYLRIHPTEHIKELLAPQFENDVNLMDIVDHTARCYAKYAGDGTARSEYRTYSKGDTVVSLADTDRGYLHGRAYYVAAALDKDFAISGNDVVKQRVTMHSRLDMTQQSTIETRADYKDAVANEFIPESRSGVFYDLLPKGCNVIKDSLSMENGTITGSNVLSNYKGSGRELLVVYADLTGEAEYREADEDGIEPGSNYPDRGYAHSHALEFDVTCSWLSILDGGLDLYNVAAYEADEKWIGNRKDWSGEPDDPSQGKHCESAKAVITDAELMKDLDADRNDPSFVYAGCRLKCDAVDMTALTQLTKLVQAAGTGEWHMGSEDPVVVPENGHYSYRLYVRNDRDTTSRNIIFLDSLENFAVTEETDSEKGRWHGKLLSVDVSELEDMGAEPVVYYSTAKGLDISKQAYNPSDDDTSVKKKLEDAAVWTTAAPSDMSTVTAIAVDASKKKGGGDFVLGADKTLYVDLYMRAPMDEGADYFNGTDGTDYTKNGFAYNEVYMDCDQTTTGGAKHAYLNYYNTKVGIYGTSIKVVKEWADGDDADGYRPDEVTIHLYANNADTGRSVKLNQGNGWTGTFEHVQLTDERGRKIRYSYVEEMDNRDKYEMKVTDVTEDGNLTTVTLTNTHVPETIDIPVTKKWADEPEDGTAVRPDKITVRLYQDGVDTGKVRIIRPDASGNWQGAFTGLPKNHNHGQPYSYTVAEEPVEDYITSYAGGHQENITNSYYPYSDLIVRKKLSNATEAAKTKDFMLSLELHNDDGSEFIGQVKYAVYNDGDGDTKVSEGTIMNGGGFRLKGGQYAVFKDVPTHLTYLVTESKTSGFTASYDSHRLGVIKSHETADTTVTNRYASAGRATVNAKKTLTGRILERWQFEFGIFDEEGIQQGTAFNEADGSISFSLKYTEADDGQAYTYTIKELSKAEDMPGYTIPETEFKVKVSVRDNGDGTLTCTTSYLDADGTEGQMPPTFANAYHAKGSLGFQAWKVLTGRTLKEDEFTFVLKQGEREMGRAKNKADGTVTFSPISFTEQDAGKTYAYTVEEETGSLDGVNYDKTQYACVVTVKDNGDGTLSFDQEYKSDGEATTPVFTNTMQPGNLTISKYTDQEDVNQEFRFRVRLTGDGVKDGSVSYEIGAAETKAFPAGDKGLEAPAAEDVSAEDAVPEADAGAPEAAHDEPEMEQAESEMEQAKPLEDPAEAPAPDAAEEPESGGLLAKIRSALSGIMPIANASDGVDHGTVVETGTEGTVKWTIYSDGTLLFEPQTGGANGTGTFSGTQYNPDDDNFPSWTDYSYEIKKIASVGTIICGNYLDCYFYDCSSLTDISGLAGWDTSKVTSMDCLFYGCSSLTDVNGLANWKTGSVTEMCSIFYDCSSLTDISGLARWDTSKVTDMYSMFSGCSSLTNVNALAGWDTHSVTRMDWMFLACSSLTNVDGLASWKTGSVTEMGSVFSDCSSLTNVDGLASWDTSKVTSMNIYVSGMFYGCSSLTDISGLARWDTSKVTGMQYMFRGCSSLANVNYLANWNTISMRSMNETFYGCSSLTDVNGLANWKTGSVTNMYYMFYNCSNLTDISGLTRWDTSKVTDMYSMFRGCSSLTNVDGLANWKTISDIRLMFYDCSSLTDISALANWKTGSVTKMGSVFSGCSSLTNVDGLASWDTSKVTSMNGMFEICSSLTNVNALASWKTDSVTNMEYMFNGCTGLTTADFTNWDTGNVTKTVGMFDDCSKLSTVTLGAKYFNYRDMPLPNVPSDSGYNGKWVRKGEAANPSAQDYTRDELAGLGAAVADIWVWQKEQEYTINFNSDGGTGSMSSVEAQASQEYTIPTNKFRKYGFRSMGWTDKDSHDFMFANGVAKISANQYAGGTAVTLYPIWESVNGSITMRNGEFDIILHGGEKATIENLPAGASYQVYEQTPSGWRLVKSSGDSGTIESLQTADAEFYNQKDASAKVSAQLAASKLLDGTPAASYKDETFQFILTDMDKSQEVQTVSAKSSGLIEFTPITYETAGVHRYRITEKAGSHPELAYDTAQINVTVTVKRDDLTGGLYAEASYGSKAVFENASKPGSLKITKTAENKPSAKDPDFTFDVALFGPNGAPFAEGTAISYKVDNGSEKTATVHGGRVSVSCRAGETVTISPLPAGTKYEVSESDIPPGWTLKGIAGAEGAVPVNAASSVTVTNAYAASGTAVITAHKRFTDGNLESGMFTFELTDEEGRAIQTVTNGPVDTADRDPDGPNEWFGTAPVVFDEMDFDHAGTYKYHIKETKGNAEGVTYDEHVEDVTVTVTDNGDGTLSAEVEYDSNGPLFTNVFSHTEVAPETGSLTVSKTVGNVTEKAKDKEFEFTVTLADGNGAPASGRFAFKSDNGDAEALRFTDGKATFRLKGGQKATVSGIPEGYAYSVEEGETPGFTLAKTDGKMSGTIATPSEAEASYTNVYSALGELTLEARKEFPEYEMKDGEFAFDLLDSEGRVLQTAYSDADGNVTFTPLDYTDADDGEQYVYYIVEEEGDDPSVEYDSSTHRVVVDVTDNGDGTVTAAVNQKLSSQDIAFTNRKAVGNLSITKKVAKLVMGDVKDKEWTFTIRLTPAEGVKAEALVGSYQTTDKDGSPGQPVSFALDEDGTSASATIKLKHGQTTVIQGILNGTTYRVEETLSPEDSNSYEARPTGEYGRVKTGGTAEALFVNMHITVRLPITGGPGASWILICGLLACLAGLAMAMAGRRRRKKT